MLLSTLIAGGVVVAIAASDRPSDLWRTFARIQPVWLLPALGAELVAYVGYVLAYRALVSRGDGRRLSLMLTVRLVVAGFGPFVPLGGFAFDRLALRAVHRSRRRARIQVLRLGVVEYLLLALAAFVCAVILFVGDRRASPVLTLPWIIAVPPGMLLGWTATQPRVLAYFQHPHNGTVGRWIGDLLAGVEVMRSVVKRPLEHPLALLGIALYWAGEIACLGFALRCFGDAIPVPALTLAYATGYAASRRSLPLGGAGITEALLTLALIAVHVDSADALLAVLCYRVVNFLAPTLPGLLAHSSLEPLLESDGAPEP